MMLMDWIMGSNNNKEEEAGATGHQASG